MTTKTPNPFSLPPQFNLNIKRLLWYITTRRLPPQDLFTSKTHYYYYKYHVHPKLKAAGKQIFLDGRRYYKQIEPTIIASPNYIFIMVSTDINRLRYNGSYEYSHTIYHHYLVFVDRENNNRIGVVKLMNAPHRSAEYENLEGSSITIQYTEDDDDVFSLPYDPNFETVIGDRTRIRVQGDITIEVEETASSVQELMKLLSYDHNLETSIADYTKHILLDYIARALTSLGLHITHQARRTDRLFERLIIPQAIRYNKKKRTETLLKLAQKLIETLNLEYSRFIVMPGDRYTEVNINLTNPPTFNEYSISIYNVENRNRPTPSPYDNIVIELEENTPFISDLKKNELYQAIRREVEEALLTIEPQTFELLIGNHFIRMENVYYTSIEIEPKTKPLILPNITITTHRNTFIATQESRIWLMHPEHGVKVLRFTKPAEFRIQTINISDDYALQRTRINLKIIEEETKLNKDLKKLLEQLGEDKEEDYQEEED